MESKLCRCCILISSACASVTATDRPNRPFTRRLGNLLSNKGDLVIPEPPLVQPVRTRDLLERIDGGLDPIRPGNGDELDVSVHVADCKDAAPAGFIVRIDRDAAVRIQADIQSMETSLSRTEIQFAR